MSVYDISLKTKSFWSRLQSLCLCQVKSSVIKSTTVDFGSL